MYFPRTSLKAPFHVIAVAIFAPGRREEIPKSEAEPPEWAMRLERGSALMSQRWKSVGAFVMTLADVMWMIGKVFLISWRQMRLHRADLCRVSRSAIHFTKIVEAVGRMGLNEAFRICSVLSLC